MLTALVAGFQTVPIRVREQLSVAAQDPAALTTALHRRFGAGAVVATCNRFELYCAGDVTGEAIISLLSEFSGVDRALAEEHFTLLRDDEAVRHLFRVAGGLNSMVLGEFEILGQLRRSLDTVRRTHHDVVMERLFQCALHAGRRARAETGIARAHMSLFSVLADQAAGRLGPLAEVKIVVVGAGEAAIESARALRERGAGPLTIVNRSLGRAEDLAARSGGRALGLERIAEALADADLVVTAVGSTGHVISAAQTAEMMASRAERPLHFIDVAVPTNVDPAVRGIPSVSCWDIDDLRAAAARSANARRRHIPQAEAIIEDELDRFATWVGARSVIPTIASLTARAEELRSAQVERSAHRMNLDAGQRDQLERLTQALVKQLLHAPIATLRSDEGGRYAELVTSLFAIQTPRRAEAAAQAEPEATAELVPVRVGARR